MNIIKNIKKIIPIKIKETIKKLLFFIKYKFFPPPLFTDMSGYELLMDTIIERKLHLLEGDFVEIGAFIGGGTYKLSKLLKKLNVNKNIYVLDTFQLSLDDHNLKQLKETKESHKKIMKDKKQYEVFKRTTKNCNNIIVIIGDSKKAAIPCEKISFSYIDGDHSYDYVKNDFYLVWQKVVSGGVVAFHDYNPEYPQTIKAIHELIAEQADEISQIWTNSLKSTMFFLKK